MLSYSVITHSLREVYLYVDAVSTRFSVLIDVLNWRYALCTHIISNLHRFSNIFAIKSLYHIVKRLVNQLFICEV